MTIISKEVLDEYFKKEFLPYVTSFYDLSVKSTTGIDDFLRLILHSIQALQMNQAKVY